MTLISVVIPLYNKEDSIKETVNSVLNQSFLDFELLIVNDGSTDNSIAILDEFDDKRIQIVSIPNGGVSNARNIGVKEAKGEFIYFLDADDLMRQECLKIFSDLLDKYENEHVFVTNYKVSDGLNEYSKTRINSNIQLFRNSLKAYWNKRIHPRTGSILIRKKCFDEIGFFDVRISIYEDLDFLIRLFKKYKTVYTNQVVFVHLLEYNSLSKKPIDFKKYLAFYIDLKNTFFYEKLLLSENLYHAYLKFKRNGNHDYTKLLIHKNFIYIPFIFFMIFLKKYVSLKRKISKRNI